MKIKKTLFKTEIEITTGEIFDLEHYTKWNESLIVRYYKFLLRIFN